MKEGTAGMDKAWMNVDVGDGKIESELSYLRLITTLKPPSDLVEREAFILLNSRL